MAFFNEAIQAEIKRVARVFYIDRTLCTHWNAHRRGEEDLRLLTGYCWQARDGSGRSRSGFKTASVAMRDAYYVLIRGTEQPADVRRPVKPPVALAKKPERVLRLVKAA